MEGGKGLSFGFAIYIIFMLSFSGKQMRKHHILIKSKPDNETKNKHSPTDPEELITPTILKGWAMAYAKKAKKQKTPVYKSGTDKSL